MPVRRRDPKVRRGLTPESRDYLLSGLALTGDALGDDAAAALWSEHRLALIAFYISNPAGWTPNISGGAFYDPPPGGPGTRPWAFWQFEAPEARRVLAPAVEAWAQPTLEREADYLVRHGL